MTEECGTWCAWFDTERTPNISVLTSPHPLALLNCTVRDAVKVMHLLHTSRANGEETDEEKKTVLYITREE